MSVENSDIFSSEDLIRLKALPEFQEMQMRAKAAEAKLQRIYSTPFWKITKPVRKVYARLNQSFSRKIEKDFKFTPNPSDGTPVIDLVKDQIEIEANNANLNHDSIVVIAHFSNNNVITQSLNRFINGFLNKKYSVILVSASTSPDLLMLDLELKSKITIIRKPNLGYDFGSWAVAFDKFPEILNAENLILTNDSLIGPFEDFSDVIDKLESSSFDITGITDNSQLQYHIQSYLMLFKANAIQNSNVQNLLKSVVHLELKNDVILKYELGLTRTAQLSGLFVGALFPWNLIVSPGKNPSLAGWKRLINIGFPFLKREAVRLGSHSEVASMKDFISGEYKDLNWAISEINSLN
jgi:Rhamnan synthesis protein F